VKKRLVTWVIIVQYCISNTSLAAFLIAEV